MHALDTDSRGLVATSELDLHRDDPGGARSPAAATRTAGQFSYGYQYFHSNDILELLCCTAFGAVCLVVELVDSTTVRERPIPYQLLDASGDIVYNLALLEELTDDTVSDTLLIAVAVVIPIVLQLLFVKVFGKLGEAHATVCVYLVAIGLTTLVTALLKNYVGYLRPVFYALCQPDGTDLEECTGGDQREARRSFPSGHASTSFCGMILFTLFLLDHFGISNKTFVILVPGHVSNQMAAHYRRPPRTMRLISILCLMPMAVAFFIAASRVVDNKHFPADVTTGAILGSSIGWFIHRLWFPPFPYE